MKRALLILALVFCISVIWTPVVVTAVLLFHYGPRCHRALERLMADVEMSILTSSGARERYTQGW
jgi:hypothetical protein